MVPKQPLIKVSVKTFKEKDLAQKRKLWYIYRNIICVMCIRFWSTRKKTNVRQKLFRNDSKLCMFTAPNFFNLNFFIRVVWVRGPKRERRKCRNESAEIIP